MGIHPLGRANYLTAQDFSDSARIMVDPNKTRSPAILEFPQVIIRGSISGEA